jgi:hypothetical protein
MNTAKLAAALNTLSLGLAEAREALLEQSEPERVERAATPAMTAPAAAPARALPPPASEPSPFETETFTWEPPEILADEGSEAICPKHRVPYTNGQYGPYCKNATDDPAWGKRKGDRLWCRITPRNAAEYLRVTAAA